MLLVYCSCSVAQANTLAQRLVEKRLAACVTQLPNVQSTYRWQDDGAQPAAIVTEAETLLMIKTTEANYAALETTLCAAHDYELPEIIAVPVSQGLPDYLAWVEQETGHSSNK